MDNKTFCELIHCPFLHSSRMASNGVCVAKGEERWEGSDLSCIYVDEDGRPSQIAEWVEEDLVFDDYRLEIQILAALAKSGRLKKNE